MGQDLKPDYVLKAVYAQEEDCTKPVNQDPENDGYNFLEIETTNGGGGTFFVMKTKRWAFDNVQEMIDIINDFVEKSKFIKDGDDN